MIKGDVMKYTAMMLACVACAFPGLLHADEEMGRLNATFGDVQISQPTVLVSQGDQTSPTAYMINVGWVVSSLTFMGYSRSNEQLILEVEYMGLSPDAPVPTAQSAPVAASVSYAPTGNQNRWISEDAPSAPQFTFTTLEVDEKEGRAAGSFSAVLCYAESYASGPDLENCKPIEGTFETRFLVEEAG